VLELPAGCDKESGTGRSGWRDGSAPVAVKPGVAARASSTTRPKLNLDIPCPELFISSTSLAAAPLSLTVKTL
jgi:hypothetical protein